MLAALAGSVEAHARSLPSAFDRGVTLVAWWHDAYDRSSALRALDDAAAAGVKRVVVLTTWYQGDANDNAVAPDAQKTPSDGGVSRIVQAARRRGMKVALKPHVDRYDGDWRGRIVPSDPDAWFRSYRRMIDHYATLATATGADTLVVGTELKALTTAANEGRWRTVIRGARNRFDGRLTYAANWDEFERVPFWDALDAIGVDAYFPLSGGELDPTTDRLVEAWTQMVDESGGTRRHFDALAAAHARTGKPVLFTEIGYQSMLGTTIRPWQMSGHAASQPAQARAYDAALEFWSKVPWMRGTWWWSWDSYGYDPFDTMWNPRGKLAQDVMSAWYRGVPDDDPPPPPPLPEPPAPPPAGKVSIAEGARFVTDRAVDLAIGVPARAVTLRVAEGSADIDAAGRLASGLDLPLGASVPWELTAAQGTHTVHVQFGNEGGWSPVVSDDVVLDSVAPKVAVPRVELVGGEAIGDGGAPVLLRLEASDATSGLAGLLLDRAVGDGPFAPIAEARPGTLRASAPLGASHVWRVSARDLAGLVASAASAPQLITVIDDGSSRIAYRGAWRSMPAASAIGGATRSTGAPLSRASITTDARAIAWVAPMGRNRGSADVEVDGRRVGVVNLSSDGDRPRRLVYVIAWPQRSRHTVAVARRGLFGPRVDIDAFLVVER